MTLPDVPKIPQIGVKRPKMTKSNLTVHNGENLTVLRYFAMQIGILQFTTFPIRLAISGNCPTKNKIQCIAEADVSNPANIKV